MVTKNIISPVIEETSTVNSSIRKTTTNYGLFTGGTGNYAPASIQTSINGGAGVTEMTFDSYDPVGNLTQKTGKDGIITAYLWGYNSLYPVAEVKGMTHATASSLVNPSVLEAPPGEPELIAELNDLRTGSGNLVNSFTYLPLIGVTSMTSPEGNTNYYEYDHFGRLARVRDYQKKIIKQMDYGYVDAFSTNAINLWYMANTPRMATFYQLDCPPNSGYYSFNRVLFGGSFTLGSTDYQNDNLEAQLNGGTGEVIPVLGSQCPSPLQHVRLKHTGIWFADAPTTIDVTLVQDEHTFYRRQFKPVMSGSTETSYVPVGTFKIIWNPNPAFARTFCGFWLSDGTTFQQLKSGDNVTFLPGVNYEITSFDNM